MATIQLLTTNSLRAALGEIIPQFERASGHRVAVSYDPAKMMLERIRRGEKADAAMLSLPAIETLGKEGRITHGSRRPIASCGVGLGVLAGAPKPDIGSVEAFKKTLLAAKSVAWTVEGVSGMHFSGLIERLGIAGALKAKAVQQPGGLIGDLVVAGKAEMAVQQIPELMAVPGVELVGPLPDELQKTTPSVAAIFTDAKEPAAAQALLDFLASAASARVFKAHGHEPARA
jgi:molybdate transport system substrate-binding protein